MKTKGEHWEQIKFKNGSTILIIDGTNEEEINKAIKDFNKCL